MTFRGVTTRQENGETKVNIYGCKYFPQDSGQAEPKAQEDYQLKLQRGQKADLYLVTPNEFALLESSYTPTSTPTSTSVPSLVTNYGFEENYKIGWNSEGNIEMEQSTNSYNGQYALCFTQKGTQSNLWVIVDQMTKIEGNTLYNFYVMINSEEVTNFHLRLDWYEHDKLLGDPQQIGSEFNGKTNGWEIMGGSTIMSPPNATHVKLRMLHGLLDNGQAVQGSSVCVDEVLFYPVP